MNNKLAALKGIHPGFILERELQKRQIGKGRFAISLNEFPQTMVSITKGKRRMNTCLAMKIENALDIEEGFLMTLQVFYDIKEAKKKNSRHPNLSQLRPVLFWDTKIDTIDWEQQKNAVIKRVFSRGNDSERNEIINFYGQKAIDAALELTDK